MNTTLTSATGLLVCGAKVVNVVGRRHTVTHDAALAANRSLGGMTHALRGGGTLAPAS